MEFSGCFSEDMCQSGSWRATTGCQKKKFITTKTKGIEEATKEKTDMKNKD